MNICEICELSKSRRLNLNKINQNPSKSIGDRLYIDSSWINVPSGGGNKYWFLIVDELSGYCWARFGRHKYDIVDEIIEVIFKINNDGYKVKTIRLDNAGEHMNLQSECNRKELGINFEYTAPYTPQHNGVVERKFQTLYNKIRSCLNQSGIEEHMIKRLWAECASTVTKLDNITTHGDKQTIPYEIYHKNKPLFLENMHEFGEIGIIKDCHLKIKFTNKLQFCIFLGYKDD